MTLEERQTLQEKHSRDEKNQCFYCLYERYPCDVIKVLDATENLKFNNLKVEVDCTHIIGLMTLPEGWDVIEHGQTSFAFTFCPKCGEKLLPSCDHNETKTIETSFYYLNLPPVVMDCLYCVKCKMKL